MATDEAAMHGVLRTPRAVRSKPQKDRATVSPESLKKICFAIVAG